MNKELKTTQEIKIELDKLSKNLQNSMDSIEERFALEQMSKINRQLVEIIKNIRNITE